MLMASQANKSSIKVPVTLSQPPAEVICLPTSNCWSGCTILSCVIRRDCQADRRKVLRKCCGLWSLAFPLEHSWWNWGSQFCAKTERVWKLLQFTVKASHPFQKDVSEEDIIVLSKQENPSWSVWWVSIKRDEWRWSWKICAGTVKCGTQWPWEI